jgi:hypothetical protein
MSLQESYDRDRRRRPASLYAGEYSASGSGSGSARIMHGSNAEYVIIAAGQWFGGGSTSAGLSVTAYAYSGATSVAAEEEYDPAFVAKVLAADAAPVEARFDNVVDLMDWLERD